jgi:hypothetical protein
MPVRLPGGCRRVSPRFGGKALLRVRQPGHLLARRAVRKPFMQWLAEMSPQEVAALPPQKREMRRRWLEGNARGEVRTISANWRPGA